MVNDVIVAAQTSRKVNWLGELETSDESHGFVSEIPQKPGT
jgi:hypothetical protein